MRRLCLAAAIIALLQAGAGCHKAENTALASGKDGAGLDARLARLTESLANPDSGEARGKPIARWLLPPELAEISGLALTPDGRLFAHNDETARITEIDYRRGVVIKHFFVGEKGDLSGDFEGLACAGDRFFLLESNGKLYEFREGAEGERVDYTLHDTHLGKECEFEGVAYDSTANALVLACKRAGVKQLKKMLLLYRYRLDQAGGETSELTVPYSEAVGKNSWKQLRPTDITVDPSSGNYALVAAQEKALVVLTPAGAVVLSRPLGGRHAQPEGIAITRDHILIIADEATNGAATITLYHWPRDGVRDGARVADLPLHG
jgi:uncharacterized protein YjiK